MSDATPVAALAAACKDFLKVDRECGLKEPIVPVLQAWRKMADAAVDAGAPADLVQVVAVHPHPWIAFAGGGLTLIDGEEHAKLLGATSALIAWCNRGLAPPFQPPADPADTNGQPPGADLAEQYVTLDQMAALVNRAKKTLARKANASNSDMPAPDVEGGGGKPHEWKWSTIRPWLEKQFKRQLPETFPR